MKIAIGFDHGGFPFKGELVRFLKFHGHEPIDCGCFSEDPVDYPDYAEKAILRILNGEAKRAILVCGTGIGMSIAANKYKTKGIKAALVYNVETAELCRKHNDAIVLCLGARQFNSVQLLLMVEKWLTTEFSGDERHARRLNKLEEFSCNQGT